MKESSKCRVKSHFPLDFKSKDPLAIRNNNPLNIRYSPRNKWKGLIGSNQGFCVFDSLEHGIRAALILLCNYQRNGYDTIRKIVARWAPASENNTEAYIAFVCGCPMSFKRDSGDDANVRITCHKELFDIALAMAEFEIGNSWLNKHIHVYNSLIVAFYNAFEQFKYPELKV